VYASKHRRNGRTVYQILDLCTRCRRIVNFTIQQLYLLGKEPLAPLEEKVGGTPRSGLDVLETGKISFLYMEYNYNYFLKLI
jgi:hypothetical protein